MVERERKLELEKQRKRQLAILLGTTIPSGVAMIVLMILAVIYRKAIYHKIWEVILSLRYPKVYKYWRFLKGFDFRYMDKLIEDTKYMPKKAPKKESSETSDSSDMGVELDLSMYDSTLIKPQDGTSKYGFRAHEIFHYLQKRRYIISENPKSNDIYDFWSMIKNEGVKAIVAITYENDYDPNGSYIPYWPAVINFFGNITVRNYGVSDMSVAIARAFSLELTQGDSEEIEHISLYVVHGWKHGSTAMSPRHLVELYNSVSLAAGGGTVLVHSRVEPISGVFLFTYFAAVVEILEKGRNVKNEDEWDVMLIIKRIRSQIHGGSLSGLDMSYLFAALVDYFVKRRILQNDAMVAYFFKRYDYSLYIFNLRETPCMAPIKYFLFYLNEMDKGKLNSLIADFEALKPKNIDPSSITKFTEVSKLQQRDEAAAKASFKPTPNQPTFSSVKFRKDFGCMRFYEIPCLDANAVEGVDLTIKNDRYKNFLHANEFSYKIGNVERKMILCQAPLKNRCSRVLDVIFKEKLAGVVILSRDCELAKDMWYKYYPDRDGDMITFGGYTIENIGGMTENEKGAKAGLFGISKNKSDPLEEHEFRILHFLDWEDEGVPVYIEQFIHFCDLINSSFKKKKFMIQCNNGVGRSGVLALYLHLVDVLDAGGKFDMKKALLNLRAHRALSIQKTSQYVMVLWALIHHYRNDINATFPGNFRKVEKLIKDELGIGGIRIYTTIQPFF
uniref:Tyrosine-protein phosphatase domain-containing protein n=1 Tax=Parastrongyloides trichosuri TaxID=131310 RepID=A0A0N4ZEG8_PARTI